MTARTHHPPPELIDAIRELLRLLDDEELEQGCSDALVDSAALHCFACEVDVGPDDWDEHECGTA
ncbi:hypothetical protein [Leifsonia aquatica]|uniref:hypothetical protein n=1 Tax=Leifsonia aquatica TaxID=144185 RepID=UPI0013B3EED8|nr:hypothetical protein [Leifsonia aquatica]